MSKAKELVFHRPHPSIFDMLQAVDTVDNIEQVKIAKLLCVLFSDSLNFDEHIKFLLFICSQRL